VIEMEPDDRQLIEHVKELIERDPNDPRLKQIKELIARDASETVERFYTATVTTDFDQTTFRLPFRNPDNTPKTYAEVWRIIHDNLPDNRSVEAVIYVNHQFTGRRVRMTATNYREAVPRLGVLIRQVPTRTAIGQYFCAYCDKVTEFGDRERLLPFCNKECQALYDT